MPRPCSAISCSKQAGCHLALIAAALVAAADLSCSGAWRSVNDSHLPGGDRFVCVVCVCSVSSPFEDDGPLAEWECRAATTCLAISATKAGFDLVASPMLAVVLSLGSLALARVAAESSASLATCVVWEPAGSLLLAALESDR